MPRFDKEANYRHREARLFALAYPRLALERAIGVVRDPEAFLQDRTYAVRILGCLAAAGSRPAKQELLSLTYSDELAGHALSQLLRSDSRGDYRDRYKELARERKSLAVHALGMWPDPEVPGLFDEVLRRDQALPSRERSCTSSIVHGREKQFLMKSDAWKQRAKAILSEDAEGGWWCWRDWAYLVARRNGLPGLKELLRARLDRALENAKLRRGFAWFHKKDQIWSLTDDSCYDDTLVMYAELGGSLKEPERRRLEYFGYVGNPRQRLREVLAEE